MTSPEGTRTAQDAAAKGITAIHQETVLFDELSVLSTKAARELVTTRTLTKPRDANTASPR